jgi:hypothetical protein
VSTTKIAIASAATAMGRIDAVKIAGRCDLFFIWDLLSAFLASPAYSRP